jgi:hypothetical protein
MELYVFVLGMGLDFFFPTWRSNGYCYYYTSIQARCDLITSLQQVESGPHAKFSNQETSPCSAMIPCLNSVNTQAKTFVLVGFDVLNFRCLAISLKP